MIEVICVRGNGDKEMSEVEEKLLTSISDAVLRGKYEIDKQWYLILNQTLEVPFKKTESLNSVSEGDIVSIFDGELGISGKRRVSNISIIGTPSDVSMSLTTQSFEDYI